MMKSVIGASDSGRGRKNNVGGLADDFLLGSFLIQKLLRSKIKYRENTQGDYSPGQYCVSYKSEQRQSMRGSSLVFQLSSKTKTKLSCRTWSSLVRTRIKQKRGGQNDLHKRHFV